MNSSERPPPLSPADSSTHTPRMPNVQEVLALARLVIIALAAVTSSVVATVLHRKMMRLLPSPYYRYRHPQRRRRGPAVPKLFFSVMLTDWFFGCSGAISLSMDLVMGYHAKMRNVLGVTMEGVFEASLLATMLWGPILSLFVLIGDPAPSTSGDSDTDTKHRDAGRPFRVRTSWLAAWVVAATYGLLVSTKLQAKALDWPGAHTVETVCLVYLSVIYGGSFCMVLFTGVVLYQRRRRAWDLHYPSAPLPVDISSATNTTGEPTPMLGRSLGLADSRFKQQEAAAAVSHDLHVKIVRYLLVVLVMQFPYMLSRWEGFHALPLVFIEIGDCLLFSVPLFNMVVFACWKNYGIGPKPAETRDRDNDSNPTMLQSATDPGHSGRVGMNGTTFGLSARPGAQGGVFGQGSRVGGALASSYRSFFGSSANNYNSASANREKDVASLKGTFIGTGQDQVTLDDLDGLTNVSFIGEGASGSVYKAQWLGIEVAMKIIKLPNTEGGGVVDAELYRTIIQNSEMAFIEEASLCARLRHPNITLFMRAGFYDGKLGILTEYCARGSLKDVLKQHFPLSWRRKVSMALHISKGLTYLHARNPTYIHRDLKASNILVTDTWQAKVAVSFSLWSLSSDR